jgi:hypothetical protein
LDSQRSAGSNNRPKILFASLKLRGEKFIFKNRRNKRKGMFERGGFWRVSFFVMTQKPFNFVELKNYTREGFWKVYMNFLNLFYYHILKIKSIQVLIIFLKYSLKLTKNKLSEKI